MLVEEGVEARNVNGILGLPCREHFPGLVWTSEYEDPEIPSFDQYALFPAAAAGHTNMADQVIMELWMPAGTCITSPACKRRVPDLYHESRLQAHIDYNATYRNRRIHRTHARGETEVLTWQQYLQVISSWCATFPDCWAGIVDKWLDAD